MEVTLPLDLKDKFEQELASGRYHDSDELIAEAVRHFLDNQHRSKHRLEALRRLGKAVDEAGLYERVLVPDQE